MSINGSSGTRIWIGPATAAATKSAYAALAWTEIKEVQSIAEFGDSSAPVNFTSLSEGRVKKLKGPRDAGDVNVVVGHDPLDAGQLAAIAAEKTPFSYAVKVQVPDAEDDNHTDSVFYFHAKVMSARLNPNDANSVTLRTIALGIDTEVLDVPSVVVSS